MESDQTTDLAARKRALRRELLALRVEPPAETRGISSRTAAWHALSSLPWRERAPGALFLPLAGGSDTLPVLRAAGGSILAARGRDRYLASPARAALAGRHAVAAPDAGQGSTPGVPRVGSR